MAAPILTCCASPLAALGRLQMIAISVLLRPLLLRRHCFWDSFGWPKRWICDLSWMFLATREGDIETILYIYIIYINLYHIITIIQLSVSTLVTRQDDFAAFVCSQDERERYVRRWNARDSIGTTCMVTIGYPLVMTNSLLLKMAIEIVDLPINSMVDLSIVTLVYQRVHGPIYSNIIPINSTAKIQEIHRIYHNFIHFPILSQWISANITPRLEIIYHYILLSQYYPKIIWVLRLLQSYTNSKIIPEI